MSETTETIRCEHGFAPGDNSPSPGLVFAAPFDECQCCKSMYPYVNSASHTFAFGDSGDAGGSRETTHTPGLCDACGGKYVTTYAGRGSYDVKRGSGPWEHFEWWTDDAGEVHTKTTPRRGLE